MNKHIATAKIATIGNSVGIVLPKDALARLRVGKGDTLCLTETPDGVLLTPYSAEFAEIMDAAEIIMRENRDALHARHFRFGGGLCLWHCPQPSIC